MNGIGVVASLVIINTPRPLSWRWSRPKAARSPRWERRLGGRACLDVRDAKVESRQPKIGELPRRGETVDRLGHAVAGERQLAFEDFGVGTLLRLQLIVELAGDAPDALFVAAAQHQNPRRGDAGRYTV